MTVIPSFLDDGTSLFDFGGMFSNFALREGEVKEIVYPDDPKSITKRFIEYQVMVDHRENGSAQTKMYTHCLHINTFAGKADKSRFTFRADTLKKDATSGNGSKVFILCVNGETNRGVILGGPIDAEDTPDAREAGHNLELEFNGVNLKVNKDGEFTVTYKGATNADCSPAEGVDTDKTGTSVSISKDGTFKVATKKQSITIDNSKGTITIDSDETLQLNGSKVNVSASEVNIEAGGNIKVDMKGVMVDGTLVQLGGDNLVPGLNGIVTGQDVCPILQTPLGALGMGCPRVLAKK